MGSLAELTELTGTDQSGLDDAPGFTDVYGNFDSVRGMILGLIQPLLYLTLFAPLLKPVVASTPARKWSAHSNSSRTSACGSR